MVKCMDEEAGKQILTRGKEARKILQRFLNRHVMMNVFYYSFEVCCDRYRLRRS